MCNLFSFFAMAQQPLVGQGLPIIQASRAHSDTSHSVWPLWTRDQPDAEPSTWQHTTFTRDRNSCRRRDSNPTYQQASRRRPTPYAARPLGSAKCIILEDNLVAFREGFLLTIHINQGDSRKSSSHLTETHSFLFATTNNLIFKG
jgi:hypothetical protein